jgi:quaternary ammonium compound-resistance protein SugE
MKWTYLFIAGFFEIFWAVGLKFSQGFSKIVPSIFTVIGILSSFYFLSLALRKLPLSIAYAIWTGIGIVGTFLFGVFYFGESISIAKIICVILIVGGIAGLRILN